MKGILGALVVLLLIAFICDLKTDKVPNILILSGYGIGVVACVLRYGANGVIWGIFLVVAVWLICMPVYLLGGLGGGDCKLLAWIVLFFEPEQLLECYFFIFLCGGVIALIKLIAAKRRTFHFTVAAFLGVIVFLVKTSAF
ncbi:MAG: hypothetical protein E7261_05245 [Lachnospiraceae bacterium]|nr:hypothetical protein [Lachnospiraceae bacterium]